MKHAELVRVVQTWLRTERKHGLVLAEPSTMRTLEEPDVIGWCAGVSSLVECKVSRSDFLVDKKLDLSDHGVEPWVFGAEVIDEASPEYVALRRAAS
jgi:hypothetical protein